MFNANPRALRESRTTRTTRTTRVSAALVLSAALGACMSDRPPLGLPDASVVSFDGVDALPPDCRALALRSTLRDPDLHKHPAIPFGCANYTNLAAQLARPADIVSPLPYAGGDGNLAARAVQRYGNPPTQRRQSQDSGAPAMSTHVGE